MRDAATHLKTTFPWLTEDEAATVAGRVEQLTPGGSAGDALGAIADLLDSMGLQPTSTLLLALAGRGSKSSAHEITRRTARNRFERATQTVSLQAPGGEISPASRGPLQDHARGEQRGEHSAISALLSPEAFALEIRKQLADLVSPTQRIDTTELLTALNSIRGEVAWLKSTIDTERQLRRYYERHGPLAEPGVPAATASSRLQAVSALTSSLQREKYREPANSRDEADGPTE